MGFAGLEFPSSEASPLAGWVRLTISSRQRPSASAFGPIFRAMAGQGRYPTTPLGGHSGHSADHESFWPYMGPDEPRSPPHPPPDMDWLSASAVFGPSQAQPTLAEKADVLPTKSDPGFLAALPLHVSVSGVGWQSNIVTCGACVAQRPPTAPEADIDSIGFSFSLSFFPACRLAGSLTPLVFLSGKCLTRATKKPAKSSNHPPSS